MRGRPCISYVSRLRKRANHRGLTIAPVEEVNRTSDRADLTLAQSKPEAKKVYEGGLHDYRHYEGKENWDD